MLTYNGQAVALLQIENMESRIEFLEIENNELKEEIRRLEKRLRELEGDDD